MFDKELIDKVCNLNCVKKDVNRNQTTIKYDIEYPFEKYYDLNTIINAINKYIKKEWDDKTLSSWFCIYNWILCGGFDDNLKENFTDVEDFLVETISWDLDGMSFFDDWVIESEGIQYLYDCIEEFKSLDHIWKTRNEWNGYYSPIGESGTLNENQYVLFINEIKKEYIIIHSDHLENGKNYDNIKFVTENEFDGLVNQLKYNNYKLISYSEKWYYCDLNNEY